MVHYIATDADLTTGICLIDRRMDPGAYDLGRSRIIIDHPRHGRLLLAEEYSGEGTPRGGQYRWGSATRLQPTDTFCSLEDRLWNDSTTWLEAVDLNLDDTRPCLDWPGYVVAKVVDAALGLTTQSPARACC
jgi:hypothetical protein